MINKVRIKDGLKKGLKKYWWIIGIALLIKLFVPDLLSTVDIPVQSVFGSFGIIGLNFGVLMIIASFLVVFIPGWGVLLASPLFFTGLILAGGSVLSIISSIFESIVELGTPIIIVGVVFIFYFISKIFSK